MNSFQQYKNFISGRYFSEGLKIAIGILLPSVLLGQFDLLETGIMISLGASAIAITDNPGPIVHRRNGMLVCLFLMLFCTLAIGFISPYRQLLYLCLPLSGFLLSMMQIYGNRASLIGLAVLIVGILSLQQSYTLAQTFIYSFWLFFGGVWYIILSLFLYTIRPYKLIQQVLGDYILDIAGYFRGRARFYTPSPDYDDIYKELFLLQSNVEKQQTLLSEMMFKTRAVVKESTNTSRRLLKLYLDSSDLFESIMSSFHDYNIIHKNFGSSGLIERIRNIILRIAVELDEVGIAVKQGSPSKKVDVAQENIIELNNAFTNYKNSHLNAENLEAFISMGRIIENIGILAESVTELHYYTNNKRSFKKTKRVEEIGVREDTAAYDIRLQLFLDNLSKNSNTFRHSVRMGVALLLGLIVSDFLSLGHSYWMLLTIAVIIKPEYSLTKQRNRDRLLGTVLGLFIGVAILLPNASNNVYLALLAIFMILAYAFMRMNYFLSVVTTTIYVVILFHLLDPQDIGNVLFDRLFDTVLGSLIAFVVNKLVFPTSQSTTIMQEMQLAAEADLAYFELLKHAYMQDSPPDKAELARARKKSLLHLVSLADAFNRLIIEPKRYRAGEEFIHRFAVMQHTVASNFATLNYFFRNNFSGYKPKVMAPIANDTSIYLMNTISLLKNDHFQIPQVDKSLLENASQEANQLLQRRRREITAGVMQTDTRKRLIEVKSITDQFHLIHHTSKEMHKAVRQYLNSHE